jgi:uncharacterized Zn finger protein
MDSLRQMRGMEMAETRTIRKRDGWWWVPSQTGRRLYRVQLSKKFATCECPDCSKRGEACKHIVAVLHRADQARAKCGWFYDGDKDGGFRRYGENYLSAEMVCLQ